MLQPGRGPIDGSHYLEATTETSLWGQLPNRGHAPVLTVNAGDILTVDTVSHEGILEDQGRDPDAFFGRFGVSADRVLDDARALAASSLVRDSETDGPHVVTGPMEVHTAEPGDVLKVEILSLRRRLDYGIVSSRHGRGALPGEFPQRPPGTGGGSALELPSGGVSTFCTVERQNAREYGSLRFGDSRTARFPLRPFLGIMGVAADTDERLNTIPPGQYGGNLDIKVLASGSALYLPVQVDGAGFYTGDPHFAQGNGEVALTAFEAPLRATFRLTVLKGAQARAAIGSIVEPFGETEQYWVAIGLHEDLNEAMRRSVRAAVQFLTSRVGMDGASAYAYLSAAADLEVSQVVDRVQGVHCLIRKSDFDDVEPLS
ncbi:MAG: acetamidase [Propionibacteriales bacterium]|nr:acetamidase [Propionibacteriales bacterium]